MPRPGRTWTPGWTPSAPPSPTPGAELYLLTDATTLMLCRLRLLVDLLSWTRPEVLYLRIRSLRARPYRESAVTNRLGQFLRFERGYEALRLGLARVALTSDV